MIWLGASDWARCRLARAWFRRAASWTTAGACVGSSCSSLVARLQSQLDAHLLQLRLRRPHVEIELLRLQRGQNIARRDQGTEIHVDLLDASGDFGSDHRMLVGQQAALDANDARPRPQLGRHDLDLSRRGRCRSRVRTGPLRQGGRLAAGQSRAQQQDRRRQHGPQSRIAVRRMHGGSPGSWVAWSGRSRVAPRPSGVRVGRTHIAVPPHRLDRVYCRWRPSRVNLGHVRISIQGSNAIIGEACLARQTGTYWRFTKGEHRDVSLTSQDVVFVFSRTGPAVACLGR